jgi:hypothetical protein
MLLHPTRCPKLFGLHEPDDSIFVRDDKGNVYPLTGATGIDDTKGQRRRQHEAAHRAFLRPSEPEARTISITVAFDYYNIQTDVFVDVGCFVGGLQQRSPKTLSGQSEEIKLEDFR